MDGTKYAFPLTGENVLMDFVVSLTIGVGYAGNPVMGLSTVEESLIEMTRGISRNSRTSDVVMIMGAIGAKEKVINITTTVNRINLAIATVR